jgi:hypothetical protein
MLKFITALMVLSLPVVAHPDVLVVDFHPSSNPGLEVVADDVRSAIIGTVEARGGSVFTRAALAGIQRSSLPECVAEGQLCDLAIARALHADILVSGELREIDGELSLSLEVTGIKSGKLLAGRRASAAKFNALGAEARDQAKAALEEVFERLGPPKLGALRQPSPTASTPAPVVAGGPTDDAVLISQKANLFRGVEAVGGSVVVTKRTIRFEAHAVNVQNGREVIQMADVVSVEPVNTMAVVPNGALVRLRDGGQRQFVLEDRDSFIHIVRTQLSPAR